MRIIVGSKRISNFLTKWCSATARSCDPLSGNFSGSSCMLSSFEFSSPTTQGQLFSFSVMLTAQKDKGGKGTRYGFVWGGSGESKNQTVLDEIAFQRHIFGKVKPGPYEVPFSERSCIYHIAEGDGPFFRGPWGCQILEWVECDWVCVQRIEWIESSVQAYNIVNRSKYEGQYSLHEPLGSTHHKEDKYSFCRHTNDTPCIRIQSYRHPGSVHF